MLRELIYNYLFLMTGWLETTATRPKTKSCNKTMKGTLQQGKRREKQGGWRKGGREGAVCGGCVWGRERQKE